MTAALFLADPTALTSAEVGGAVALSGPEGRHAVQVKRIAVGEQIDLGDGQGTVVRATVEAITGRDRLVARVHSREVVPPAQPRLVVVQALPKGDRGETAVETLTEVGADVIVPWQAQRCIARWVGERAERGRAKWLAAARAAGKQARRARFPEVAAVAGSAEVAALIRAAACAVVLHEASSTPLRDIDWPVRGDIVLVVGPEGGVSPQEIEMLTSAGAALGRMGPTVMRSSTAGTVAAAVVLASTDRWA